MSSYHEYASGMYILLMPRDIRLMLLRVVAHSQPTTFLHFMNICKNETPSGVNCFYEILAEVYDESYPNMAIDVAASYALTHHLLNDLRSLMPEVGDREVKQDIVNQMSKVNSEIVPIRMHLLSSCIVDRSWGDIREMHNHHITIYVMRSKIDVADTVSMQSSEYNAWRRICWCQQMRSELLSTLDEYNKSVTDYYPGGNEGVEFCGYCRLPLHVPWCYDGVKKQFIEIDKFFTEVVIDQITYIFDDCELSDTIQSIVMIERAKWNPLGIRDDCPT
jgi:hypothetical protein